MGSHHRPDKKKAQTDTHLFLASVVEEACVVAMKQSSTAYLHAEEKKPHASHRAHSNCNFHVNFFHHNQLTNPDQLHKPTRQNGVPHLKC